jgi:squalene-hopene cyclase-like protein
MNLLCHTALLITLMVAAAFTVCNANDQAKASPAKAAPAASPAEAAKNAPVKPAPPVKPPGEAELRSGITKSLGYLAKAGEEWMAAKNCNGCHHLPELLWSHREAKLRGFAVDPKKFDEWLAWAAERETDKKPGLEEAALMLLALPERPAPQLTKLLATDQKADGSWNPAGQFSGMQKRGAADATANSTRLSLIALATPHSAASESDAARTKAAAMLAKKDTPTAMESLVFRTLFARRFGKPEEARALVKDIVKQQRGDGGWGYLIGENMSDVLATGQVLYVLQADAADPPVADAIARAQHWLLKTQREDGGWSIDITHISKLDRSGPAKAKSFEAATDIYTYWGSSWATIGLLQGVPVK